MKRICCVGIVTADLIVKPADAVPPPGKLQAVDSICMHVGGCAANAAVDLQMLGIPTTLITKVGKDSFGRFVTGYLKEKGLAFSGVVEQEGMTTAASMACVSSSGERSFLYHPRSNDSICLNDINMELVAGCDIVFVAGSLLMATFDGAQTAEFLKRCQTLGKYTALDTAWDFRGLWMQKIEPCLPYLNLFMPSYDEAARLSGETDPNKQADCFFQRGAQNVIIKLGKDGALICEHNGERFIAPAYTDIKPVDTTGAGDSFCAGFLAGLAQGWSFRESAALANAVGAHCIMEIGASSGIRPMEEMAAFIQEHP